MSNDSFKALLLDLSGVLYDGDRLIAGAREAVREARREQLILRFVTNTATKSRHQVIEKLEGLGIDIDSDELFTAPDAAKAYLQEHKLSPCCLIHASLQTDFEDICSDDPDAVLLGDARDDLNYASLNRAFRLVQEGHPLIAIGENKYFQDGDQLSLDVGPCVHALA
jgi:HAD superfamily hydrolase (TIGR01458 family)